MIYEISKLTTFIGMSDPLKKIYVTNDEHVDNIPLILFIIS